VVNYNSVPTMLRQRSTTDMSYGGSVSICLCKRDEESTIHVQWGARNR